MCYFCDAVVSGVMSDEARRNYTRFVLLDHQDWLKEEVIARSWRVLSHVGAHEHERGAIHCVVYCLTFVRKERVCVYAKAA